MERTITPADHRSLVEDTLSALRPFRQDLERNQQLAIGAQWSAEDKQFMADMDRFAPIYDIVSPNIEAWIGAEIGNRTSMRVVGREPSDRQKADVINKVLDHDNTVTDLGYKLSLGARYAAIYRYAAYYLTFEYTMRYPEGQYVVRVPHPLDILFDYRPHEADFDDSNYIIYTRWFTADHIIQQYANDNPDLARELERKAEYLEGPQARARRKKSFINRYGLGSDTPLSDENKNLRDFTEEYNRGYSEYVRASEGLYRVVELHEKIRERTKVLVDYNRNIVQRLPEMSREEIRDLLTQNDLTERAIQERYLDSHYLSVSAYGLDEKKMLYHEPYAVQGCGFMIKIMPFYNTTPNRMDIRSLVDKIKDMQELINREHASRAFFMQKILNPSWLIDQRAIDEETQEAALLDPRAAKVMKVNDSSKAREVYPPFQAAQLFQQSAEFARSQADFATGFGPNIRGARQTGEESGKLFARRLAQQENMLTSVYMNVTKVLRSIEEYHIGVIQTFYKTPRLIRVLGPGGQDEMEVMLNDYDPVLDQVLNDVTVGRFDIILDKRKFTETDKEYRRETLAELIQSSQPEHRALLLKEFYRLLEIPDTEVLEEFVNTEMQKVIKNNEVQLKQLEMAGLQLDQQLKQLTQAQNGYNQITAPEEPIQEA